ncbi:MAG TPA: guanylate kinase [Gammaproteobacteria bacterium]|nr:guanylate kinase [Gammaproteobacteria bacterium]|tara:strand:- start:1990 stop:2622 length:633 start_codon:yes stop_codon:yes gene_type:complete
MNTKAGNLLIISAPSGAGKTSLVHGVVKRMQNIAASISHTTRPRRPGETDGVDYFFITEPEFEKMIQEGEFLEYAQVFGNLYGTSRTQIDRILDTGIDLLVELDWQGARSIRDIYPDTVSIFVMPPSEKALRERLVARRMDQKEIIQQRMQAAMSEISHYREYEFLVINDDFERALQELCLIVGASRLKTASQRKSLRQILDRMASEDSV